VRGFLNPLLLRPAMTAALESNTLLGPVRPKPLSPKPYTLNPKP